MAPPRQHDGLLALQASVSSIQTLIESFRLALRSPTPPHPEIQEPPQPLALLSDSCKILKAQTTKLSLLILNKPFTPSAIVYILDACSGGCLPALMSALEFCPAQKYSQLLHNHIKSSLSRIMTEMLNLLESIPQDERGIDPQSRGTLASTGVIWAECDKLVALANDGIISLTARKIDDFHDLLKDAIAELEEWNPESDESESDTDSLFSNKQTPAQSEKADDLSLNTSFCDLSISPMIELQKRSLGTLRTVRLLYPALRKRRILNFPNITYSTPLEALPSSENINRLDTVIMAIQSMTEEADEIAGALYENNGSQVVKRLEAQQKRAERCAFEVKRDWRDKEDEFSVWADKWAARLNEIGSQGNHEV